MKRNLLVLIWIEAGLAETNKFLEFIALNNQRRAINYSPLVASNLRTEAFSH